MKQQNRATGQVGERIAEQYLVKKGYELVQKNFSTRFGEIDLIFLDKKILVFVEVKTKIGEGYGKPEEMFTKGKYTKVKRMAQVYLKGNEVACRIDMVAIVLGREGEVVRINHYENVVY